MSWCALGVSVRRLNDFLFVQTEPILCCPLCRGLSHMVRKEVLRSFWSHHLQWCQRKCQRDEVRAASYSSADSWADACCDNLGSKRREEEAVAGDLKSQICTLHYTALADFRWCCQIFGVWITDYSGMTSEILQKWDTYNTSSRIISKPCGMLAPPPETFYLPPYFEPNQMKNVYKPKLMKGREQSGTCCCLLLTWSTLRLSKIWGNQSEMCQPSCLAGHCVTPGLNDQRAAKMKHWLGNFDYAVGFSCVWNLNRKSQNNREDKVWI